MINKSTQSILLKGGILFDPYKNKKKSASILIENGLIKEVGEISLSKKMKKVDCQGKIISPGFIDIHAHFREPGMEDKETLETGARAAFSGGFTRVCVMPNTNPPLDSPESIRFIIEKTIELPVKIFPIGAITINQK